MLRLASLLVVVGFASESHPTVPGNEFRRELQQLVMILATNQTLRVLDISGHHALLLYCCLKKNKSKTME